RADAHQFAMFTLHPMLVLQGVPAFIDSQFSDSAHIIADMVVVMSEMHLASLEHVKEVEAALAAGLNVAVVVPEGTSGRTHKATSRLISHLQLKKGNEGDPSIW
ncbi:hypothetical protein VaNZ11_003215, partial [Volvox africanus]